MKHTALTKYLEISGWISVVTLNLGGIFYIYWSKKYRNDERYDSWVFWAMHWAMAVCAVLIAIFVSLNILPINDSAHINILWFSFRNPPKWAMILAAFVVFIFSVIPLYLAKIHRLTSR